MLVADVAKKAAKNKPGPVPNPDDAKSSQIIVRCRPDYKAWALRYAASEDLTLAELIDNALLFMARHDQFEMPPER